MEKKKKMRRTTLIFSFITLASFLYKAALGFLTMSQVLLIASVSTLLVFICKILFVRNVIASRDDKKKAYLFMTLSAFIYSLIFIAFVVLKVNGIDISNNKTYEGWQGGLFIGFMLIMFILSIIGLKGSLEKTDLMVIGLKEIIFISTLADVVIIEEFTSRIIRKYATFDLTILNYVDSYIALGVGCVMLLVSIIMLIRFFRYEGTRTSTPKKK